MKRLHFYLLLSIPIFLAMNCTGQSKSSISDKVEKTNAEWKEILNPMQYHVLIEKGTERPFTGEYNDFKEKGTFNCAACNNPLFKSDTKYDSGSGWPSFYNYASDSSLLDESDYKLGMVRTEIICARCEGHLGHVFDDGPKPTGKRYCINSASLVFEKKK